MAWAQEGGAAACLGLCCVQRHAKRLDLGYVQGMSHLPTLNGRDLLVLVASIVYQHVKFFPSRLYTLRCAS